RPECTLANRQPCQQGLSVWENRWPASTEETPAANQQAPSQPPECFGSCLHTIGQDNCPVSTPSQRHHPGKPTSHSDRAAIPKDKLMPTSSRSQERTPTRRWCTDSIRPWSRR